jgi:hypothetical protein
MNLASRCREAISHVAMLKKELAMHQRRAAEALALQRQQHQAPVPKLIPNVKSKAGSDKVIQSTTDVAAEMDRMDRLMAVHAPPPPPPNPPAKVVAPAAAVTDDDGSPKGEFYSDYDEEGKEGSPSSSADSEDDELGPEVGFGTNTIFAHSASPRIPAKANDYNEGFPDDLPQSARKKLTPFRPSAPEISEVDSDANSVSSSQSDYRRTIMSSIDAFEASFVTNFPESFSSSPKEEEPPTTSAIYNPFFPSPRMDPPESVELTPAEIAKAKSAPAFPRSHDDPTQQLPPRSRPGPNERETINASTSSQKSKAVNVEDVVPSTPPRLPSEGTALIQSTPDDKKEPRTPISLICRKTPGDGHDEPPRPEKTASATARARYEKALQPRTNQTGIRATSWKSVKSEKDAAEAPNPEAETPPQESSIKRSKAEPVVAIRNPNPVLQRLQQRRANSPSVTKISTPAASSSPWRSTFQRSATPIVSNPPSSAPFPKTQPFLPNRSPEPVLAKSNLQPKTPNVATTDESASPSVSSAISVFEQGAKRNEEFSTTTVARPSRPVRRATSFGSPQFTRPTSPGFVPSDEEDEGFIRSKARSSSASDVRSLNRKRAGDEEDDYVQEWNQARGLTAKELQSLTSRSNGFEKSSLQNGGSDEFRETARHIFESRSQRTFEGQQSKELDSLSYQGHYQRSSTSSSSSVSGGARNSLRNVTKPLSYAEPSLNSKLRQGDVFFAKSDAENHANGEGSGGDYVTSVRL